MQNIELCRCLCNENNVVTKDNVTGIESNVTCKNCLMILKKNYDVYLKQRMGRTLERTKLKGIPEKEFHEQDIRLSELADKIFDSSFHEFNNLNKKVSEMFKDLDDTKNHKKVVEIKIKRIFEDGTFTGQTIKIRR